jgi:ribosome-binding factor A
MGIKQERMAGRIRQILSELLLREVGDPRLQMVSITEVQLDEEMQFARVYVIGDEFSQEEVMPALERAKGFLRREVGKRVRLRKTPELAFRWDSRFEEGARIDELIDSLGIERTRPQDAQKSRNPVVLAQQDDETADEEWDD